MRLRPSIFALLFVHCVLAYALPVAAQESEAHLLIAQLDESAVLRNDPDPVLSETETRNNNKSSVTTAPSREVVRDSVVVKPVKPIIKASNKDQPTEDPLSFNFLYYIIGKFKMSDIIE